jgi:uncharacterized membrane protein YbaN (DUF454 family)
LLLASFCFVRSSPRLHAWLLRNRVFGPFLRDWQIHRGVRRSIKITAISMILVVGCVSAASGRLPLPALLALFALLAVGLFVVLRLRTIEETLPAPELLEVRLGEDGTRDGLDGRAREFIETTG